MRKEVSSLIVLKVVQKQRDGDVSSEFSLGLGHSSVPFNIGIKKLSNILREMTEILEEYCVIESNCFSVKDYADK